MTTINKFIEKSVLLKTCKARLHLALLWCLRLKKELFRWKKSTSRHDTIRVFYGHDNIPRRSERSGGGIIKCQDLDDIFPNNPNGADVLYLVSSALPTFSHLMVRIAKKRGVKLVWNQNGVAYPGWHGPGWEKFNFEMKENLHQADYVVYQSQFCKLSADKYLGKYQGPYEILYNPVDTQRFCPANGISHPGPLLLAGSHEHFYRVRAAVEMMKMLQKEMPNIKLLIAGRYFWKKTEEEARAEVLQLVESFGLQNSVIIEGGYTQHEAISMMQSASILIHTKYNDPCPRLVVEALACGVPVVYSRSGGVYELVGDFAGIGIEAPLDWDNDHAPDPVQLAEAVKSILQDYTRYSDMARERAVNRLDTSTWLKRHEEIFREVVGYEGQH